MKKAFLLLLANVTLISFGQVPIESLYSSYSFSGVSNDETGTNNFSIYGATLTNDRFNNPNSAYYFDGSDYMKSSSSLIGDNDSITISFWVYIDKFTDENQYIISNGGQTLHSQGISFSVTQNFSDHGPDKRIVFQYADQTTGVRKYIHSSYNVELDNWYHVTGTWNKVSQKAELFVDGQKEGSPEQQNTSGFGAMTGMYLGRPNNTHEFLLNGKLDDIRVYHDVLDQDEVLELYYENTCEDTTVSDTIFYYVSNDDFKDKSPYVSYSRTDELSTKHGGCDSTILIYEAFVYEPNYCTQVIYDTVSVADTLVITRRTITSSSLIDINKIKLYPNPTSDILFIETSDVDLDNTLTLEFIDSKGVLALSLDLQSNLQEVSLVENLMKGMYLLRVIDGDQIVINKKTLIIE